MVLLKIGNFTFNNEELKKYKTGFNKIDGEGTKRNANGKMRRQVVADKIKLEITTVPNIKGSRMKLILQQLKKDSAKVTYLDESTGTTRTIDAYFNTPETDLYAILDNERLYEELSFNIIEL